MNKKRMLFLVTILVLLICISSFAFHIRFSADASCRSLAMNTKGYSVWTHQSTKEGVLETQVLFSDKYNNPLTCTAKRIGPFWVAASYSKIQAHCVATGGNPLDPCPEDYFGVEP